MSRSGTADAGTLEVTDDDVRVLAALQKGREGAPWITMFYNSDRIQWSKPT